jgi:cytochrome c oxidase subunit 2
VFLNNACVNCHNISGTAAKGKFGPDLTHLASRDTIASGTLPNNARNLRMWIDDPDHSKPGSRMPAMHLNPRDLDAVTAYMTTLR